MLKWITHCQIKRDKWHSLSAIVEKGICGTSFTRPCTDISTLNTNTFYCYWLSQNHHWCYLYSKGVGMQIGPLYVANLNKYIKQRFNLHKYYFKIVGLGLGWCKHNMDTLPAVNAECLCMWQHHIHILSLWHMLGTLYHGFQSADSIYAINLLTSGLFTVNTMWTNWNVLSKM